MSDENNQASGAVMDETDVFFVPPPELGGPHKLSDITVLTTTEPASAEPASIEAAVADATVASVVAPLIQQGADGPDHFGTIIDMLRRITALEKDNKAMRNACARKGIKW